MAKKHENSGKALSAQKREQMFKVYMANGTIQSVVRELPVSKPTAMKYKVTDNWDKRVAEIQKKAAKKADNTEANRLAGNLLIVKLAKEKLVAEIKKGIKSKTKVNDLDKLVRLEEFLSGSPDSRPDSGAREKYKDMTIEQLLALRKMLNNVRA